MIASEMPKPLPIVSIGPAIVSIGTPGCNAFIQAEPAARRTIVAISSARWEDPRLRASDDCRDDQRGTGQQKQQEPRFLGRVSVDCCEVRRQDDQQRDEAERIVPSRGG